MNIDLLLLHLSLIDGVGPITIKKIVEQKPHDFDLLDLYRCTVFDIVQMFGVSQTLAANIVTGLRETQKLEQECVLLQKHTMHFISLVHPSYPQLLKTIHAPPAVLYWRGANLFHEALTIAFVGSRKAHKYAEHAVQMLIPPLVERQFVIVSGGAIGADSMAHQMALRAGGKTVAVLGSGLLQPYPASNRLLFDDIVQSGGSIVSAFPLMCGAAPGNFPARNRIIAGLGLGCVVVQAAVKSGASITAQCALDEGREVFAVPGPIGDELSLGCHNLIHQGAKLVSCVEDILVEFRGVSALADRTNTLISFEQSAASVSASFPQHQSLPQDDECELVRLCAKPCSIDELSALTDMQIDELHERLFDLQLAGKLMQNFAGMWERALRNAV